MEGERVGGGMERVQGKVMEGREDKRTMSDEPQVRLKPERQREDIRNPSTTLSLQKPQEKKGIQVKSKEV